MNNLIGGPVIHIQTNKILLPCYHMPYPRKDLKGKVRYFNSHFTDEFSEKQRGKVIIQSQSLSAQSGGSNFLAPHPFQYLFTSTARPNGLIKCVIIPKGNI